jgi:23S rRNA (pseudouridine1915-N3)-methyltransferase
MEVHVLAIESSRPAWAKEAFDSYASRFNRTININWKGIKPVKRTANSDTETTIYKEGQLLLSAISNKGPIVSLDKTGKIFDTLGFKRKFDNWSGRSNEINFLIGGPDGLSKECLQKSDENWSLSNLTFPHAIVPVIVAEQIYRIWSINQNHPYHR